MKEILNLDANEISLGLYNVYYYLDYFSVVSFYTRYWLIGRNLT